jgi:hypothetical protein
MNPLDHYLIVTLILLYMLFGTGSLLITQGHRIYKQIKKDDEHDN